MKNLAQFLLKILLLRKNRSEKVLILCGICNLNYFLLYKLPNWIYRKFRQGILK